MVTIVAEAGVNHNGSLYMAQALVDAARNANADIVKFQTYDPDKLMRKSDPDFKLLESLALSREKFIVLSRHCESIGIEFMTTPGEVDSLKFAVEELGVRRIKLGSDDLTNIKLQDAARETKLHVIQSTGMGTLQEIGDAAVRLHTGFSRLTMLHCVSCYPCHIHQANLNAMATMKKYLASRALWPDIGYSDHTGKGDVCMVAAALGANMIEAHMMLMFGPPPVDEAVSFTPMHFSTLVKDIRNVEVMLGSGKKEPNAQEKELMKKVRKGADGYRGEA